MDRLTIEYCGGYVPRELCSIDRLGGADDCDLCFEYCKALENADEGVDCTGCVIDRCFNRLGAYEDTGLTPEQIKELDGLYKAKCEELAEARQKGNTLNLPCKIGQEVYIISLNRAGYTTGEVVSIKIGAHGASLRIYVPSDKQYINRAVEQIGQSVFFDHVAAEKISTGRNKGADKAVTNDAIVIGGKEYNKKRLCLDWFTMSNDNFFQTYGFNFNPHEHEGLYEWGREKILEMQAFREGI